jgi:hypothetical protein
MRVVTARLRGTFFAWAVLTNRVALLRRMSGILAARRAAHGDKAREALGGWRRAAVAQRRQIHGLAQLMARKWRGEGGDMVRAWRGEAAWVRRARAVVGRSAGFATRVAHRQHLLAWAQWAARRQRTMDVAARHFVRLSAVAGRAALAAWRGLVQARRARAHRGAVLRRRWARMTLAGYLEAWQQECGGDAGGGDRAAGAASPDRGPALPANSQSAQAAHAAQAEVRELREVSVKLRAERVMLDERVTILEKECAEQRENAATLRRAAEAEVSLSAWCLRVRWALSTLSLFPSHLWRNTQVELLRASNSRVEALERELVSCRPDQARLQPGLFENSHSVRTKEVVVGAACAWLLATKLPALGSQSAARREREWPTRAGGTGPSRRMSAGG